MKALLVSLGGGLGDVLLATPVARALHERYDRVVGLTTTAHRDVFGHAPDIDEVWTDDVGFGAQAARIAAVRFDAAVVTWASPRAAALPFAGRVAERVGQARRLYSRLFTRRVVVRSEDGDRTTHWTQILLDFARALGCDTPDATPRFRVDDESRAAARALLAADGIAGPYLLLHPTRGISAARARWPDAPFATLARAAGSAVDCRVIVTGAAADVAFATAVAEAAGAHSFAGKTSLPVFAALAEGARGVIAMDSGPMHVAAAVGAPTVGIFALQSDEPDRWAPLGRRTAVVRATYPCPPAHRKETCPDFACVAALDVPGVIAALTGLLREEPAR